MKSRFSHFFKDVGFKRFKWSNSFFWNNSANIPESILTDISSGQDPEELQDDLKYPLDFSNLELFKKTFFW